MIPPYAEDYLRAKFYFAAVGYVVVICCMVLFGIGAVIWTNIPDRWKDKLDREDDDLRIVR